MGQWAVTLVGSVSAGTDATSAWQRVAAMLGSEQATFEAKLQSRLPVTFRAVGEDAACRQLEALQACGVDALMLPDDGQRWWAHFGGCAHGPVSMAFAQHAVMDGGWDTHVLVCRQGDNNWQPLHDALLIVDDSVPVPSPPAPVTAVPVPASVTAADNVPARAESTGFTSPSTIQGASAPRTDGLPTHREAPALHAGFWMRVAAYIIDSLIVGIPMALLAIAIVFRIGAPLERNVMLVLFELLMLVVVWLFFALFESSSWQATPGKRLLGLRVVDLQGERIGFGRASGRFFGKILSGIILDIGYMMAGWTERKQALHGMLAGTCVVRHDGLAALAEEALTGTPVTRMPPWAVALVVVGAVVFMSVPVLAILAAMAVPAYQDYIIRTQVSEGMVLSDAGKSAVASYLLQHGQWPEDNEAAGLVAAPLIHGKYVKAVTIHKGHIVITYGGSAANTVLQGHHLVLVPHRDGHRVTWTCASPDIERQDLPARCR